MRWIEGRRTAGRTASTCSCPRRRPIATGGPAQQPRAQIPESHRPLVQKLLERYSMSERPPERGRQGHGPAGRDHMFTVLGIRPAPFPIRSCTAVGDRVLPTPETDPMIISGESSVNRPVPLHVEACSTVSTRSETAERIHHLHELVVDAQSFTVSSQHLDDILVGEKALHLIAPVLKDDSAQRRC